MSGVEIGALCVVGAFLLFAAVRLFRGPVKLALRVLVNSALGFGGGVAAEPHCRRHRHPAGT